MVNNKKGITLTEVLAYLAIIGIVAILLTSTIIYALRTYDQVKGQGALNTQASNIMTRLLNELNNIEVDYIQRCDINEDNICVDLVNEKKLQINEFGIIEEKPIDEHTFIIIDSGNIYINNLRLNDENYFVESFTMKNGEYYPNINYEYNGLDLEEKSYEFILKIRLVIYQVNKNGEKISHPTIYENRFSYKGK